MHRILCVTLSALAACSDTTPKTTTGPSVPAKPKRVAKAAPTPLMFKTEAPKDNPALLNLLKNTSTNCTFVDGPRPEKCPRGEAKQLEVMVMRMGASSLPTLTVAASSSNAKLRDLATWFAQNKFQASWFEAKGARVDTTSVHRLRELVSIADTTTATRLARVTTWGAGLDGDAVGWLKQLAKHPSRAVRAEAYRHSMRFGGLQAFEVLSDVVGKEKDKLLREAAIRAPLEVARWSPEMQAAVCPFATDLLLDASSKSTWPALMVARCPNDFVDTLHKTTSQRMEAGTLHRGFVEGLGEVCADAAKRKASPRLCEQTRRLLTQVVHAKKVGVKERALALQLLGQHWPDAQTSKVAKQFSKLPEPHFKHVGRKVLERVERVHFESKKEVKK